MSDERLATLGWHDFFSDQLSEPERGATAVARVTEEQKRYYFVEGADGTSLARTTGKLRHAASDRAALPAVGDWVVLRAASGSGHPIIERILTRKTKLSRKAAGVDEEQVLCANVDVGFIVQGLDTEPNLRRIERFITLIQRGGARAVIVLSKCDLCEDGGALAAERVRGIAGAVPQVVLSGRSGAGVQALAAHWPPGETAVLLGPSGAGKSTLVNRLADAALRATGEVRAGDAKGRHVTTARTLLRLPTGQLVIDTPGIRELELWGDAGDVQASFDDIGTLAERCRFRDCAHEAEPDCAVRAAIDGGALAGDRLRAFQKLRREAVARAARDLRRR